MLSTVAPAEQEGVARPAEVEDPLSSTAAPPAEVEDPLSSTAAPPAEVEDPLSSTAAPPAEQEGPLSSTEPADDPLSAAAAAAAPAAPADPVANTSSSHFDQPFAAATTAAAAAPAPAGVSSRPAADAAVQPGPSLARPAGGPLAVALNAASAMERAQTLRELFGALRNTEVSLLLGVADGSEASACEDHVRGIAQGDEQQLLQWPVVSVNEWGTQQQRVLVLTSGALYRLHYRAETGVVDHHTRTSLGAIRRIERGRLGYKLQLTAPDGRENPFNWAWTEVSGSKSDARYEKVYYPRAADPAALQAVMEVTIMAIAHANRLLVAQVGGTRATVADYAPAPSHLDKLDRLADRVAPAIESTVGRVTTAAAPAVDKLNGKLKGAWASLTAKARS